MKKYREIKWVLFALIFMVATAVMPQKIFAEENADIVRRTGDLKPQEPELYDGEISTYGARTEAYSGTDYELFSILEERVKEAMLAGKTVVNISDLNLTRDGGYAMNYYYGYSPYFPKDRGGVTAWVTSSGQFVQLTIDNSYGSVEETKKVFQEIDQKLSYIYQLTDDSMTDEQKAITIHDYLVSHAEYDYSFSNYTSYGVLMEGKGVCQSYAFAYMYIMNHLGVETHFLPSNSMNHAWNVVKVDGDYYNVDCTFDDPTWNGADRFGAAMHSYFLRSTQQMKNMGHTFDTEPYGCNSTKYSNAFWSKIESPVYFRDGMAYYASYNVYQYGLADGKSQQISANDSSVGVTLGRKDDFLYYATAQKIYAYSMKNGSEQVLYDATEKGEKIKGVIIEGNDLYYQGYTSSGSGTYVKSITLQDTEGISGVCGTDVKWNLNNEGVLTISGTGDMTNYTYRSEMPWYPYISQIHTVKIENGVSSIGDYAFYGMTALEQIDIPEGVKTIGAYAFKNCTLLEKTVLPSTLKKLGESAFFNCNSLEKINIPEGMYTIWGYTFKNCTSLREVSLPSTLIKLDEAAFYGCTSLEKLEIPDQVAIIGIYCFKNCSKLNTVHLPEALTGIREAAFYGTGLTEVAVPKKTETIGKYAFKNCTALQAVEMQEQLKKIDDSAFYGCAKLTDLILPDSVTDIGAYAFKNCVGITGIHIPTGLEVLRESVFYGCNVVETVEIPAGVKQIENYVFASCNGLKAITFGGDAPQIGAYAFARVTAQVSYPTDNATWSQDKMQNYGGRLEWLTAGESVEIEESTEQIVQEESQQEEETTTGTENTGEIAEQPETAEESAGEAEEEEMRSETADEQE